VHTNSSWLAVGQAYVCKVDDNGATKKCYSARVMNHDAGPKERDVVL